MKSFGPLIQREWRLLLFGFVMMFCSSPGQTYFIALFGGAIREDLGLSHGQFGAVYSMATLSSAVLLLWTGSIIDRVDLRKAAFAVIAGVVIACIVMSNSYSVFLLFAAVLLLRHFGQALMAMVSSTAMMRYIPGDRGKAISLSNMGYSAAEASVPSLIILMVAVFSWREAWLLVAAVMFLAVPMLLAFTLGDQPARHRQYLADLASDDQEGAEQTSTVTSQRQWNRAEVLRDPLFYMFVPGLLSQSMLYTGFMFHQIHLVEEKGWSLSVWAALYLLFSLTTILMGLVIGAMVDRFGAVRLAPFVTVPMAFGLLTLSTSDSAYVAIVFMFLMGVSTGAQSAITAPFFSERYGTQYFASIKSLGTFTMVAMTAISPVILGWFIDRGVDMDSLAQASAAYALAVCTIAWYAYRRTLVVSAQ